MTRLGTPFENRIVKVSKKNSNQIICKHTHNFIFFSVPVNLQMQIQIIATLYFILYQSIFLIKESDQMIHLILEESYILNKSDNLGKKFN